MNALLHQLPLYIDDSGTLIRHRDPQPVRRLKSADGLSCVFIDYLQLLRPGASTLGTRTVTMSSPKSAAR
jgi:replicative DNA helicase